MLENAQIENYKYFNDHLNEWLNDPLKNNKFAVIQEKEIKGLYDSFEAAYQFACTNLSEGEFIIQQIVDKAEVIEFLKMAVG